MAGIFGFLEVFVSHAVEFSGGGIIHGGKGVLTAGAKKIGWASKNGNSRQGRRLAGHRIASGRMASSGLAGANRGRLGVYNPKAEYSNMGVDSYKSAACKARSAQPDHLFGRPGFKKPSSSLGREAGDRYLKKSVQGNSYTKRPRANINF